jgi:hypothetical protein
MRGSGLFLAINDNYLEDNSRYFRVTRVGGEKCSTFNQLEPSMVVLAGSL